MKNLMKNELERAFKNKWMYITLLICISLIVYDLFQTVIPTRMALNGYISARDNYEVPNAYNRWMELWVSKISQLFHFICPILVCIPYSISIYTDVASKYMYNIIIRIDKKKYFLTKLMVQFMVGTAVSMFILLTSFILTLAILPAGTPLAGLNYELSATNVFGTLFYKNPLLAIIIAIILESILFGIIGCLSYIFAYILGNGIVVMTAPFTIYLFESIISQLVQSNYSLKINSDIMCLSVYGVRQLLIEVVIMIIAIIITYILRSRAKDEL